MVIGMGRTRCCVDPGSLKQPHVAVEEKYWWLEAEPMWRALIATETPLQGML